MNPPAPPHPAPGQLEAFCLGKLAEKDMLALHAHLEGCPLCAQSVAKFREDTFLHKLREQAPPRPNDPTQASNPGRSSDATSPSLATQASTYQPVQATVGETAAWQPPVAPPAGAATAVGDLPNIPGLEVVKLLGRGGMGLVYLVRQTDLKRLAALKMIRKGDAAGIGDLARFKTEAETIARLQHDNIVQIYQVGTHQGSPYLLLEYVEGGTLAQKLAAAPLASRQAAAISRTLAQAIQFAHEKGVIHRDLKPSNILMTPFSKPKITDFGLAKQQVDFQNLTQTKAILGTPSYMAPEQAIGQSRDITPQADVYALGAILYEMVVGRPPFKGESPLVTLRQVVREEPIPPRKLQPDVPADLEAICLKCLEKQPARRYASAGDLGEDLRRFLAREPVQARPAGWLGRAARWARRRPALASLIGLSVVTVIVMFFLVSRWLYAGRLENALAESTVARKQVEEERELTREQKARASYLAGLYAAHESLELGTASAVLDFLERSSPREGLKDFRGFEWYHLFHQCNREQATLRLDSPVQAIALSPDDAWLVCAGRDNLITLWDFAKRKMVHTFKGHKGAIVALAFGPDAKTFASASADGSVRLWNAETKKEVGELSGHEEGASACAFDPKGKWLLTASVKGVIRHWPAGSKSEPRVIARLGLPVTSLALSPDGDILACNGDRDYLIRFYEMPSGKELAFLRGHKNVIHALAFAPKGGLFASASEDGEVSFWDLPNEALLKTENSHRGPVHSLAFNPADNTVITGSHDHSVRRWREGERGWLLGLALGHTGKVTGVAVNRAGTTVISAGYDQTIRIWAMDLLQDPIRVIAHPREIRSIAFFNDGSLWSLGADKKLLNRELSRVMSATVSQLDKFLTMPHVVLYRSKHNNLVLAGEQPDGTGEVFILDYPDPKRELRTPVGKHTGGARVIALSPDERAAASSGRDGKVLLWDLGGRGLSATLEGHVGQVDALAFSPDGKTLASGGAGNEVILWDVESRAVKLKLKDFSGQVNCLAFSPDGKHVVLGGENSESHQCPLQVWDVEANKLHTLFKGHTGRVNTLVFSPDGKQLATASRDQTVKLWDWATGEERATYKEHVSPITALAFSSDGRILVSGDQDGTLVIRRGATDAEVSARRK